MPGCHSFTATGHHASGFPPAGRSLRSSVHIRWSKLWVSQLPKWEVVQHAESCGIFAAEGWAPNVQQGTDRRMNVSRHLLRSELSAGGLSHGVQQ